MQDEENLISSKENLDEHFKKELNPWWITMSSLRENSGKKEWSNKNKDEKSKVEA